MPALTTTSSNKVIVQSLIIQIIIGFPFISFFILILIGFHPEPTGSYLALSERSIEEKISILHQWISLFSAAAMFGCMGALVSYLSRNINDKSERITYSSVVSIHVLGSIFGILLLLMFLGEFVAGNLFPSFNGLTFLTLHQVFSSVDGWAKLFVWSFIAGFSERLVPDLLSNFVIEVQKGSESSQTDVPNGTNVKIEKISDGARNNINEISEAIRSGES